MPRLEMFKSSNNDFTTTGFSSKVGKISLAQGKLSLLGKSWIVAEKMIYTFLFPTMAIIVIHWQKELIDTVL